MKDLTTDVVIVGGGPAGSICARECAKAGLDTIVIDRRQEIGAPKRCAEGLSLEGLERVGVKPDPRWAVATIKGAVLWSPSLRAVTVDDPAAAGFVVERKVMEKHFAADAIAAGARYMVKTQFTDLVKEKGTVVGIKAEFLGEPFTIRANIVVGADGIDSTVGRKAGLKVVNKIIDYHSAYQYEMGGVTCDTERIQLFFGKEVAPKGYAWIFPKAHGLANVGIGILGVHSKDGARSRDYLDRFIVNHPEWFANASPIEINGSGVPVSSRVESFVGEGVMLVGDAAQQVNPIHGGGMTIAMHAGWLAAHVAAEAHEARDFSAAFLKRYETEWWATEGKLMMKLLKLRSFTEKLTDDDLDNIARIVTPNVIADLSYGKFRSFVGMCVRNLPTLLPLVAKYLAAKPVRTEADYDDIDSDIQLTA